MKKNSIPKPGESWRRCRDKDGSETVLVAAVDIRSELAMDGIVKIKSSRFRHGIAYRSLDTFLRQYEPAEDKQAAQI